MFADDLILFNSSNEREVELMVNCVNKYCTWLRKQVTLDKSGLFGSKNVSKATMKFFCRRWGCSQICLKSKYLGNPLFLTYNKSKDFAFLKDMDAAKLESWKSKCLSWASCATLVRSVVQTMPQYTMSSFLVPKKICSELDSLTRKF